MLQIFMQHCVSCVNNHFQLLVIGTGPGIQIQLAPNVSLVCLGY